MQALNLKIKGLYTFPNNLGKEIPEGALKTATNIVIDADSIAQTRRGLNRLTYTFAGSGDRSNKLFQYQSQLLASYGSSTMAYYDTLAGWTDYSGSYVPISTLARIRSTEASQNFYFTTTAGVYKLDAYNSTPSKAGQPKGLDITGTLNAAAGGFLDTANQVAYRHLWGIKDANSNVVLGAPSQRGVITNSSGGPKDIDLAITIPAEITTAHFLQVYRSPASGGAAIEPSDEMQLVYEINPTVPQIAAKTLTFTDQTPDSLKGATLYTSPSQEGILQSNFVPPQAKDISFFSGSTFYANTIAKQRLKITIIAAGGTSGIALNDILTLAGVAFTAKNTETAASGEFKLSTGGTPAQNIADTALSLVRVINQYAANTAIYAYYLSGADDLPGQIQLEERGFGASTYYALASAHTNAYLPALPTAGTSVASSNDSFKNAIYFSKNLQPEAVPLTNVFRIGSASKAILRIVPLRESLFVFKEDGIWRVLGNSPSFRIESVDTSTKLLSPESAVPLNNQIYAHTDQGIVAVTETGVSVVSRPIEGDLLELLGADPTAIQTVSFAIGYETDRKYIFFTISNTGDTTASQAYVYNVFTTSWTRWDLNKTCGIVNLADNKLYLGEGNSSYTNIERKSFSDRDYVDAADPVNIVSTSGTALVLTSAADVSVGDLLSQSDSVNSIVTAVDAGSNIVTVRDNITWTLGSTDLFKAIESVIEWIPASGGNPGVMKHFQDPSLFLRNTSFTSLDLAFKTDLSMRYESVSILGTGGGSWGLFSWGDGAESIDWGGGVTDGPIRTYVPEDKARGSVLNVKMTARLAFQNFALEGISIPYESGNTWITI